MRECKTFCGLAQNARGVYPWGGSKIPGFYWLTQLANGVMLFSILSCFKLYRLVLFFFYAIFLAFQASAYFSFKFSMSVECICNFLQEVEQGLSINNKTWYNKGDRPKRLIRS